MQVIKNLSISGLHGKYFVFKPNVLEPGVFYRLRVMGVMNGKTPGLTETDIKTNLPPYDGYCAVEPEEGTIYIPIIIHLVKREL